MKSRTKSVVSKAEIAAMFCDGGFEGVTDIKALGAGEYNAVYSATKGEEAYVIKIAPPADLPVMTLEKNLMESELFWYEQLRNHTAIALPKIFYSDLSPSLKRGGYFIMEKLPGQDLGSMKLQKHEREKVNIQMAAMSASMHKIKNYQFGYIQNGLHDNWYQAIRAMTEAIINDAERMRKASSNGKRLLAAIDKHQDVLEEAECCMINFDTWPANIIVDRTSDTWQFAWIDLERSFWGDRIADFICLEPFVPFDKKVSSVAAYNEAADKPLQMSHSEKIRYGVAFGYLGLIMETERYYRYTRLHFGWWRNTLATKIIFKQAFELLF